MKMLKEIVQSSMLNQVCCDAKWRQMVISLQKQHGIDDDEASFFWTTTTAAMAHCSRQRVELLSWSICLCPILEFRDLSIIRIVRKNHDSHRCPGEGEQKILHFIA
jgi:hypothetical protein